MKFSQIFKSRGSLPARITKSGNNFAEKRHFKDIKYPIYSQNLQNRIKEFHRH